MAHGVKITFAFAALVAITAAPAAAGLMTSHLSGDAGELAVRYDWPNGTAVSWTLTYDHKTDVVTFSVDGVVVCSTTLPDVLSDVCVRTRAADTGSNVRVENLVLDGQSVGDQLQATANGLDILRLRGATLVDGFTLSGQTTMSWKGARPAQPDLAFQIKVGTLNPVTVRPVSWGEVKNLFNKPL